MEEGGAVVAVAEEAETIMLINYSRVLLLDLLTQRK